MRISARGSEAPWQADLMYLGDKHNVSYSLCQRVGSGNSTAGLGCFGAIFL